MKKLFSEEFRLEKISKQGDPLEQLNKHIDFEYFRSILELYLVNSQKDKSKGGRPAYDVVLMFKILVLQRYYNLSDDNTEYAILDRLSFMRFLNLTMDSRVPDAKTIWLFKEAITAEGLSEKLFLELDKLLADQNVIANKGRMVDATFTEAPVQRNSREENEQIKKGEIPAEWKNNPHKLAQKDVDARWTKHNGKSFYGYKNHVKVDQKSKLIMRYKVTPANVHDSQILLDLLEARDMGQALYADAAYRSEEIEKALESKRIRSHVHEKAVRGNELTRRQKSKNKYKSKVRARVEHVFAFMTNSMNGIFVRCKTKKRVTTIVGLNNITYNLFRIVQLKKTISWG